MITGSGLYLATSGTLGREGMAFLGQSSLKHDGSISGIIEQSCASLFSQEFLILSPTRILYDSFRDLFLKPSPLPRP